MLQKQKGTPFPVPLSKLDLPVNVAAIPRALAPVPRWARRGRVREPERQSSPVEDLRSSAPGNEYRVRSYGRSRDPDEYRRRCT